MSVKIPKETKDKIVQELSSVFGRVYLKCDGFDITLDVQQKHKSLSHHIAIYVDGKMRSAWLDKKASYAESKFMFKHNRSLYKPAQKAKIRKEFGVRGTKKHWPDIDEKYEYLTPFIASGRLAIAHLCKVCDSIELVDKNAAENELAAKAVADILEDIAK